MAPLVTGFLVDLDHFAESIRYRRSGGRLEGRVILPLHGWEFLLFWFLIDRLFGGRLAGGLTLGYAVHMAIDQITNTTTHPFTYMITYRWSRGFPSILFTHRDEKDIEWLNDSIFNIWKYF